MLVAGSELNSAIRHSALVLVCTELGPAQSKLVKMFRTNFVRLVQVA